MSTVAWYFFDVYRTNFYEKIYGYGNRIAELSQPFAADDIILLTDGVCSSTCSLFVEMMHHEAGVKIVVAGGSSEIGPMQAVGYVTDPNYSARSLTMCTA